jgi:hypothetical protein
MVFLNGGQLCPPVLEPVWLEVRASVETVSTSGPTNGFQLIGRVPTAKCVTRYAQIFRRLSEGQKFWMFMYHMARLCNFMHFVKRQPTIPSVLFWLVDVFKVHYLFSMG